MAKAAQKTRQAKQKRKPAASKNKKRHLALVVHGLGEQGPGQTLDDLAGGLWGADDELLVNWDVRMMQDIDQPDPRKLQTFPCHIRRYSDPDKPNDPHTTFAEVYWADLSPADKGAFRIFYGLIKAILGLGHIVRAGAQENFGGKQKGIVDNWRTRIANFVPYLMHGPVAGLNMALATGILFLFAASKLFGGSEISPECEAIAENLKACTSQQVKLGEIAKSLEVSSIPEWGICLSLLFAGLFLLAVGYKWSRKHDVYYFRIFLVWTALCGGLMMALAFSEFGGWIGAENKKFVVEALLGKSVDVARFSSGSNWFGVVLLFGLKVTWLATMAFIGFVFCMTVWTMVKDADGPKGNWFMRSLPLILSCAMTWLWMLVVATIWVSVNHAGYFTEQFDDDLLRVGASMLLFALMGLGLITIGVVLTLRKISQHLKQHFNEWSGPPAKNEDKKKKSQAINDMFEKEPVPRLLLSKGLVIGLLLTGLLLFVAMVMVLLELFGIPVVDRNDADGSKIEDLLSIAIAISGVIGAFAYSQKDGIAQALGVAKDLITYFKVEPVLSGKTFEDRDDNRMGVFSFPGNFAFRDFRHRRLIHNRMQKVLRVMLASTAYNPSTDELIVISHSQGTIIATEFIKELHHKTGAVPLLAKDVRDELDPILKKATLVTMGSPFTHVYNHYLPGPFKGPDSIKGKIKKWVNIFRVDDFIGTYISESILEQMPRDDRKLEDKWPENKAVPPGGHTGYWTDDDVLYHLKPLFGVSRN